MKAAVIGRYGPPEVFKICEVLRPALKPREMLVEIRASSVNPIDWKIRRGDLKLLFGRSFPMILGYDLSGRVVETGTEARRFKIGDEVYACSNRKAGQAYAEFAAIDESAAAHKPKRMSHQEAAAVPLAALTALQAFRDLGRIQPGNRVLVIGSSGGVGSYGVQLAKAMQAHVTAVCGTANVALTEELGADEIIDYKKEGFGGRRGAYDIVLDAVGAHTFSEMRPLLTQNGTYVSTLPSLGLFFHLAWTSVFPEKKARFVLMKPLGEDLRHMAGLADSGKLKSVIDGVFQLEQIAQAHARSETGRARGKIVVEVKRQ
ncbi:MAG: NAD(P)-dependent alcohol dehydrogenase [Elusimicrobia bacterium]|nr:NAD(P)-dependent alcohol dehydrogenase [Elusimicrobiota bacterium]